MIPTLVLICLLPTVPADDAAATAAPVAGADGELPEASGGTAAVCYTTAPRVCVWIAATCH